MASKRQIFAHRGLWLESGLEENSFEALQLAFHEGFGVEVDIRDYLGRVVISHDPPSKSSFDFKALVDLASGFPDLPIAINVKSDGLANELATHQIVNPHFFFDMSFPQERDFVRRGLTVASRVSEHEPVDRALQPNLWVDSFEADWYLGEPQAMTAIANSSRAVFISPELHHRRHQESWNALGPLIQENSSLGICTDYVLEFSEMWCI